MRAKAVDLFHAYAENLMPREGALLVAARDDGKEAPLAFLLADFRSLEAIEHRPAGLAVSASGTKLEWRFDPGLEIEETAFSGPHALFVRRPIGRDFAFLFPRTRETTLRLWEFLSKTFAAESGLSPAAAETAADRILARSASPQKGNS